MSIRKPSVDHAKVDKVIADARREMDKRALGYREQAMKMYPWVCGRCAREFTNANRHELTVHHRNHDHDYNPPDGSNWELLCLYCHDNEHSRRLDARGGAAGPGAETAAATSNPFADLKAKLNLRQD